MAYNAQLYQPSPLTNGQIYPNLQNAAFNQMSPMQNMNFQNFNMGQLPPTAAYVQSEIEASSFAVGPGNTVLLIDSNSIDTDNPIVYIKSAGYDGKISRFKKITGTVSYPNEQGLFTPQTNHVIQPEIDLSSYASKDDVERTDKEINSLTERLNQLDETISGMNDSISNIDNRFSNLFNVVNTNPQNDGNNNYNNNHYDGKNNSNNNRKGN